MMVSNSLRQFFYADVRVCELHAQNADFKHRPIQGFGEPRALLFGNLSLGIQLSSGVLSEVKGGGSRRNGSGAGGQSSLELNVEFDHALHLGADFDLHSSCFIESGGQIIGVALSTFYFCGMHSFDGRAFVGDSFFEHQQRLGVDCELIAGRFVLGAQAGQLIACRGALPREGRGSNVDGSLGLRPACGLLRGEAGFKLLQHVGVVRLSFSQLALIQAIGLGDGGVDGLPNRSGTNALFSDLELLDNGSMLLRK